MITPDTAKLFLRVDYSIDDALIAGLIEAAKQYLIGAIGTGCNFDDPRAETLMQLLVADLYNNREYVDSGNFSRNARKLVDMFTLQMQLELRQKAGGAQ